MIIFSSPNNTIYQDFSLIDNIATDASVSQIQFDTKPTNLANHANDGDKTTCFKSKGTNVRFQVDMTEIRIVTEVYLTGKGMSVNWLLD